MILTLRAQRLPFPEANHGKANHPVTSDLLKSYAMTPDQAIAFARHAGVGTCFFCREPIGQKAHQCKRCARARRRLSESKKTAACMDCGGQIYYRARRCKPCSGKVQRGKVFDEEYRARLREGQASSRAERGDVVSICANRECRKKFTAATARRRFCCRSCQLYCYRHPEAYVASPVLEGCRTCAYRTTIGGHVACGLSKATTCKPTVLDLLYRRGDPA